MKRKEIKSEHAGLIVLIFLATIFVVPVRAEDEYQVIVTLQAPEPIASGRFGVETKLFEGGLIIGVYQADVDEITSAGKAYIYDSDWKLKTTLPSPTPGEGEAFGRQVDAFDDKIVIANDRAFVDSSIEAGMVYLFDTDGSPFLELKGPIVGLRQKFGAEVALGKDIILVAEIGGMMEGVIHAGLVHAFDHEGTYIRNLTSPSMKPGGTFGWSIAVSDEYILVGEPGYIPLSQIPEICSVYVYDYDWNHVATLIAPDEMERTCFGISTSISSDYVIVGEPWATVEGNEKAGRAHIFDTYWNHVATLQSPTPEDNGEFGRDVALGGDIVVVGERKGDVDSMNEGKVHVFDVEGNLIATLVSPEPAVSSMFGYSVETDGEIIVVGETGVKVGDESKAGKVHVFGKGTTVFAVDDLSISPNPVNKGKTVTIAVECRNTGTISGEYPVVLSINKAVEDEKTVTIGPDETTSVSFEVPAGEAGEYSVDVNGLSGSFVVAKAQTGIPGFPFESIVISIALAVLVLWLTQRQR